MYFIKLILLAVLLSSCATTNETDQVASSGLSPQQQSDTERKRYRKAIALLHNGNLDAAKSILLEFTTERPELAGPHANLAVIALKNNNPDKALELVKVALTKNPNLAEALNLLAYLEQLNGDIESAKNHYKQAIENKEDYALAHYNIALLYDVYYQDIDSAIPHYERYMSLTNNEDKKTADWLEQIKRQRDKS